MTPGEKSEHVKRLAAALGFDRCGVAPAAPLERADYVRRWLAAGRAGTMDYLHRYLDERLDPSKLLEGARCVIMVAYSYKQEAPGRPTGRPRGRVSMYAWGADYHKVMKRKLFDLADRMRNSIDEPFESKACVDTTPLLEREVAAAAGIGWIGKNTLVMNETLGSYFFVGALVTTLDLAADTPAMDHCGTCTACLDACPTGAFPAPYEMDASRCISYLTIEHRGEIDPQLHKAMGDWIFGCDVCQQVCPHNRHAPPTTAPRFAIREPGPTLKLDELLDWTTADYAEKLRGSAIKRAKLGMLQRNARIALSNATGED